MKYINDPKPEILRIEELVSSVKRGDIKLPKFQRPFVWKKSDILTLLDSVYKGYPIGSILLWLTNQELASERNIADLEINEKPDEYPTNYILDGQQRLSTLCGALYWEGEDKNSCWNILFDLEKEVFFHPKPDEEAKLSHFPLNKLLDTFDFLGQIRTFENHPNKDKFNQNATRLLQAIKDYKIAVVRIGDMSINEVAPIFERINSTGRKLTIVDLMRAATWKGGFDLNDAINEIREALISRSFETIEESHILRNIAAATGQGINKDDIEKLRKSSAEQLQEATNKCKKGYALAVDFLTDELPIFSYYYLPYSLQLTLLVEFFNLCSSPTLMQRQELKAWFWKGAFSGYFRGFNTAQVTRDLKCIRDFAIGAIQKLNMINRTIKYETFAMDSFSLNKASSKTFALLLGHEEPKSLMDGSRVNARAALSVINRHEYHHIFPKAYLKSSGVPDSLIDAHANICMLNLQGNRTIGSSRPSVYLAQLPNLLGDSFEQVLLSNYINMPAFEAALKENYEEFIYLRSKLIINRAKELSGDFEVQMECNIDIRSEANTFNTYDEEQNDFDWSEDV